MGTGGQDDDTGGDDDNCKVLLTIIPVKVKLKGSNRMVQTYAFLDTGSVISFCTEALQRKLGATGRKTKLTVNTVNGLGSHTCDKVTGIEVYNLDCSEPQVELKTVYTKPEIGVSEDYIPRQEDLMRWPHLKNIRLPRIDAEIGLMIGTGETAVFTPLETIRGPDSTPHACRTRIGWIPWHVVRLNEQGQHPPSYRTEVVAVEDMEELDKLDRLVRHSIDLDFPERMIDDKREHSQEDKKFMQKVKETIELVDGHYKMGLPFKNERVRLPDNQHYALQRFRGLERKLRNNPKFHADYQKFMADIIEKGYAIQVPNDELDRDDGKVWYIPHHGVYHPKKPEKIRVVFDCSAKFQGVSLNNLLLQGPDLTNNLLGVLLRFRQEPIALMADIEAMFHQVKVREEDSDCLRFYWWPDGNIESPPRVYKMMVHLFGAVSSPSCANTALHKMADDNSHLFNKEVVKTIKRDFYVDDCLKSVESAKKAIELTQDLTAACKKGGFRLTKWVSNSREVLETIPKEERAKEIKDLKLEYDCLPVERALGTSWSVESDTIGFQINIESRPPTRRGILSIISSVYDPIGLAAPFILPARILLQDLCRRGIGWDAKIKEDDRKKWLRWLSDLPKLENVSTQRCYKPADFGEVKVREIHHFSDASEYGYGVASYIRLINENGRIHCAFLMGKARVAPLKKITIPRLELTAATVAVRMNRMLEEELDIKNDKVYFWTDSTSVIKYCANETSRFHTFVANRINIIREGSDSKQWKYVDTKANPADDASRGLTVDKFLQNKRWLRGPDFLWKRESEWPTQQDISRALGNKDPEVKREASVYSTVLVEQEFGVEKILLRYSSMMKLKKIVGWFLLAKKNFQDNAAKERKVMKTPTQILARRVVKQQFHLFH
ncbi:uncharacterized protein [Ptychodera flava]|uniref:uncharacterized protein n=2 Tax=Ptychodera flava TaxID=63121 RepID=UPI00396A5A26